ncbi:EamA family transporter [Pandoraea sp.]|uniref:EamA family transporter n=1 Tax=Pandoraea sp. TaxID=1883445 RepID=UPI0034510FAF
MTLDSIDPDKLRIAHLQCRAMSPAVIAQRKFTLTPEKTNEVSAVIASGTGRPGGRRTFRCEPPFAKLFAGSISPFLLAGLLYLGRGVGVTLVRLFRDRGWKAPGLPTAAWSWLLDAIAADGVAGLVLLMAGLVRTAAATASLLLNLEAVLTAMLAWVIALNNLAVVAPDVRGGAGPDPQPGSGRARSSMIRSGA